MMKPDEVAGIVRNIRQLTEAKMKVGDEFIVPINMAGPQWFAFCDGIEAALKGQCPKPTEHVAADRLAAAGATEF